MTSGLRVLRNSTSWRHMALSLTTIEIIFIWILEIIVIMKRPLWRGCIYLLNRRLAFLHCKYLTYSYNLLLKCFYLHFIYMKVFCQTGLCKCNAYLTFLVLQRHFNYSGYARTAQKHLKIFYNSILCAICTSTVRKVCKSLYSGMCNRAQVRSSVIVRYWACCSLCCYFFTKTAVVADCIENNDLNNYFTA
jgi:hypothetical protein